MMENRVVDDVFGEMVYDRYWKKTETINFWDMEMDVTIAAKAYKQRPIVDAQREAYQYWKKEYRTIEKRSKAMLQKYLRENNIALLEENIPQLTTVLFTKFGEMCFLFECKWDEEHGFAIQVLPEYKMGPQDLFL